MKKFTNGSVVLLVIVLSAILAACGSGGSATGSSDQYKVGVGVAQQLMETSDGNTHVPDSEEVVYNTVPATSGKHWSQWAQCDFYEDGLPDERITHNLEHSNIVVSYNLKGPEDVNRLRQVLDDTAFYPTWGVARFYDKIPEGQVTLATWGVLDTMEGIDPARIQRFFDAYSGTLGPEKVDCRNAPFRMDR